MTSKAMALNHYSVINLHNWCKETKENKQKSSGLTEQFWLLIAKSGCKELALQTSGIGMLHISRRFKFLQILLASFSKVPVVLFTHNECVLGIGRSPAAHHLACLLASFASVAVVMCSCGDIRCACGSGL